MGLFNRDEKKMNIRVYDRSELFRKEKEKIPMTYEEVEALKREKGRELSDQILRVLGLVTALCLVILCVGTYLYPLSIFNVFHAGGSSTFWESYNHFAVRTHGHWFTLEKVIDTVWTSGVYTAKTKDMDGTSLIEDIDIGFIDVFYMLGGWTMVVVATAGLIAVVIGGAYVLAYNIKDLYKVIKHFIAKTDYVVGDIGKSFTDSLDEKEKDKKKKQQKTPKKPKETKSTTEVLITDAPEKTQDEIDEEELNKKIEQYKKELNEEPADTTSVSTDLNSLGDADLDRLLK